MSNTNTKQWQPPHRISRTWQSKSTAVIEHWNRFTTLSAHLIQGGVLWAAEGKAGVLDDVTVSKALLSEYLVSIGDPDRRSSLRIARSLRASSDQRMVH